MIALINPVTYHVNMKSDGVNLNRGGRRSGSGRKPMDLERAELRLRVGTLARLDAALRPGETRAGVLRDVVEQELARRGG